MTYILDQDEMSEAVVNYLIDIKQAKDGEFSVTFCVTKKKVNGKPALRKGIDFPRTLW